jgi:hypothetical protein
VYDIVGFLLKLRKKPQLRNISGFIWCTESNLNEGSGREEFLRDFTSAEMLFHYICCCLLKNSYTGKNVA